MEVRPGSTLLFRYLAADGQWLDDPDVAERRGDNCVFVAQ